MTAPVLKSVEYACPICGERFSGTGWEADWKAHTETCTQELADGMRANIGMWASSKPIKGWNGTMHWYLGKIVDVYLPNHVYALEGVHFSENGFCDRCDDNFHKNNVTILTAEGARDKLASLREQAHRGLDITIDRLTAELREAVE